MHFILLIIANAFIQSAIGKQKNKRFRNKFEIRTNVMFIRASHKKTLVSMSVQYFFTLMKNTNGQDSSS
jgi:hypothetical protein